MDDKKTTKSPESVTSPCRSFSNNLFLPDASSGNASIQTSSTISLKSWPSVGDIHKASDVYPEKPEFDRNGSLNSIPETESIRSRRRIPYPVSNKNTRSSSGSSEFEDCTGNFQTKLTNYRIGNEKEPTQKTSILEENVSNKFEDQKQEISSTIKDSKLEGLIRDHNLPSISKYFQLPIEEKLLPEICFTETLIVSFQKAEDESLQHSKIFKLFDEENSQCIGGFCLSIEEGGDKTLITYNNAQYSDLKCGGAMTSLISVVNKSLQLIEEKKTDSLCQEEGKKEKSLHVVKNGSKFKAFKSSMDQNGHEYKSKGEIVFNSTGDLILDGAAFILLRYLVVIKYEGKFETWSMNISGEICKCIYKVGKRKVFYIKEDTIEGIRVKRYLYCKNKFPEVCTTYLNPQGRILVHKWKGSKHFVHVNPLTNFQNYNLLDSEEDWKNECELLSKYLDCKGKKKSEIQRYFVDNAEIQTILKDYILCLLQSKPNHVLDYALDYFSNLN